MSGFLPDIASWALGQGAGENNENDDTNEEQGHTVSEDAASWKEEDIRAKRLARMSAAAAPKDEDGMDIDKGSSPEKMEIDEEDRKPAAKKTIPTPMKASSTGLKPPAIPGKKRSSEQVITTAKKQLRKKELLMKKVLGIGFSWSSFSDDRGVVTIEMDDTIDITVGAIAEILASRLSIPPDSDALKTSPPQKSGTIAYLGHCHKVAGEELKLLKQSSPSAANMETNKALEELLLEIKKQVVSYAASSLLEPDLFELGADGVAQLVTCLSSSDPTTSITYGLSGPSTSFYTNLCEELLSQDPQGFETTISLVLDKISKDFSALETVLDDASLTCLVALTNLCSFKKTALQVTKHASFLLPPRHSNASKERVTPPMPTLPRNSSTQQQRFFRMMQALAQQGGSTAGYLKRSGPALEKDTLLGLVLRLGLPMEHPSVTSPFSNAATRTVNDVNKSMDSMRRTLKIYQQQCHVLFRSLLTASPDARKQVLNWIIDALLVNLGAAAMRPDKTKCSNPATLLNLNVVLLKLCEPFLLNPDKASLIDPAFLTAEESHGCVFGSSTSAAADDNDNDNEDIPRLGEDDATTHSTNYNPKNAFIPPCFFFTARALHFGIVPATALHINLMRQVSHTAFMLRQRSSDLTSDPNFNHILSLQYAHETTIEMQDMLSDALRFYDTASALLLRISDQELNTMPEHIVDDLCDLLVFVARYCPKAMATLDFSNTFKIVVKLLSPKYAHAVRNYNLRAKLGDVLYEVFLPSDYALQDPDESNNSNSVPPSVSCDPAANGQPYLLSDPQAQETLAPSLLLLYGEVEHTGYYDKMSHRSHIASLLKYLWESNEHRPAFRRITQNETSFIKFANGIMNETNSLIVTIMEKLPEIRRVQIQMTTPQYQQLSEEQRETISNRHEENEMEVKRALPLCNKTLQMLAFLNTDTDIRNLFLLEEMCPRLVNMLLHVLTKLIGSKGLELKVDNPENYHFRPKEMLKNLCSIFASFAKAKPFQNECAKSGYYNPELIEKSIKTCRKLNLLPLQSIEDFASLLTQINVAAQHLEDESVLTADAPEEFLDPLMCTLMKDPVLLTTSNTVIDRSTITQHLLNDPHDPFNRKELSADMIVPAVELKQRIDAWLQKKRMEKMSG